MLTTDVIRTVVCPLETSDRKNQKLATAVGAFREAARVTAAVLPSFAPHTWARNNGQIYRTVKAELGETPIKDKVVQNAVHRVIENFKSTRELGVAAPTGGIPACDFLILTNQGYDVVRNDRGYGFKAKFVPYKPEWWHLDTSEYHRQYLDRVRDGHARYGQAELAVNDGDPVVRLAVSWGQDVPAAEDAEYVVGVDVGYRTLYAAAVYDRDAGEIVDVAVRTAWSASTSWSGSSGGSAS